MPFDAGDFWVLATVIGVIILGIALFYGVLRSRKTTPSQEAARDAATREQYHDTGEARR